MRKPPANQQLRRAQFALALAVLVPVVLMVAIGVLLLVTDSSPATIVLSILILGLSASGISGYVLSTVFVGKAASLAKLQNEFVGAVSHELRTPITSIRLLMESLATGKLDADDQANVVSLLARETGRLEVLVGRVLELSRLQMSHVFRRHRLDVAAVVEEAVHAFDALTLTNPTKITVKVEPNLAVTGDRSTLVRALVNLLTNAWKYTGDDKQISIEAAMHKRRIEILVRDNGQGIPRDEQRALFEAFRRGRDALKSGAPGVGLGLSFVQAIVRGHGGKLDVQSRPGETVFRIRLKKRRETAKVGEPKRIPELASS